MRTWSRLGAALLGAVAALSLERAAIHFLESDTPDGFTVYRSARRELFTSLSTGSAEIVILGDSHVDWGEWSELLERPGVVNRGIGGDDSSDILARIDAVSALKPRVLVLMAGANDVLRGRALAETLRNLGDAVDAVRRDSPRTTIILEGVLPIDGARYGVAVDPAAVDALNRELAKLAGARHLAWHDAGALVRGEGGGLDPRLSPDGLHLSAEGYRRWARSLREKIAEIAP